MNDVMDIGMYDEDNYFGMSREDIRRILDDCYISCKNGRDYFYILDYSQFKQEINDNLEKDEYDDAQSKLWELFEMACDDKFGAGNWGLDEDYYCCYNCDSLIDCSDIYTKRGDLLFYSDDGEVYCANCVADDPVGLGYLKSITNNPNEMNRFLDRWWFEDNGFVLLERYDVMTSYGRSVAQRTDFRRDILRGLKEKHPDGEFVFDAYDERLEILLWAKEDYLSEPEDN